MSAQGKQASKALCTSLWVTWPDGSFSIYNENSPVHHFLLFPRMTGKAWTNFCTNDVRGWRSSMFVHLSCVCPILLLLSLMLSSLLLLLHYRGTFSITLFNSKAISYNYQQQIAHMKSSCQVPFEHLVIKGFSRSPCSTAMQVPAQLELLDWVNNVALALCRQYGDIGRWDAHDAGCGFQSSHECCEM